MVSEGSAGGLIKIFTWRDLWNPWNASTTTVGFPVEIPTDPHRSPPNTKTQKWNSMDRVDWFSGNYPYFILEVIGSNFGRNVGYPVGFRDLPQYLKGTAWITRRLGHHRFLPDPFEFSIHQSSQKRNLPPQAFKATERILVNQCTNRLIRLGIIWGSCSGDYEGA